MSLVQFTSDKGRGYSRAAVFVEASEVAAIEPVADQYSSSENRSTITLKNGEKIWVIDYAEAVAKKLGA